MLPNNEYSCWARWDGEYIYLYWRDKFCSLLSLRVLHRHTHTSSHIHIHTHLHIYRHTVYTYTHTYTQRTMWCFIELFARAGAHKHASKTLRAQIWQIYIFSGYKAEILHVMNLKFNQTCENFANDFNLKGELFIISANVKIWQIF